MALPANWRVALSITVLHKQLRPLAPAAPAVAFGTVADAAHTSSSGHYPKIYAGLGSRPTVTAGDFPRADRLDPHAVLDSIRRSRDPRVLYGISRGQMFSSYPAHGYPAWTWRPYSGTDGHFDHGHLSVVGDARADQVHPWVIAGSATPGGEMDPNGRDIHPDISNAQALRDIWENAVADRNRFGVEGEITRLDALTAKVDALVATLAAIQAAQGTGIGGTLTKDDVRQVVDEELDEQSRAGADAD